MADGHTENSRFFRQPNINKKLMGQCGQMGLLRNFRALPLDKKHQGCRYICKQTII